MPFLSQPVLPTDHGVQDRTSDKERAIARIYPKRTWNATSQCGQCGQGESDEEAIPQIHHVQVWRGSKSSRNDLETGTKLLLAIVCYLDTIYSISQ